jgi:hypothetical protein
VLFIAAGVGRLYVSARTDHTRRQA